MQGESATQPRTAAGAVFLSYASEDTAAAERIATALRAADIEVEASSLRHCGLTIGRNHATDTVKARPPR